MTCLRAVSLVLALAACGSSEHRSTSATDGARDWSEAERRARARQAWRCSHQGTPPAGRSGVVAGGAAARRQRTHCAFERFLCREIHRGAQATDEEKAECAGYEAVHGRVSDR